MRGGERPSALSLPALSPRPRCPLSESDKDEGVAAPQDTPQPAGRRRAGALARPAGAAGPTWLSAPAIASHRPAGRSREGAGAAPRRRVPVVAADATLGGRSEPAWAVTAGTVRGADRALGCVPGAGGVRLPVRGPAAQHGGAPAGTCEGGKQRRGPCPTSPAPRSPARTNVSSLSPPAGMSGPA